MQLMTLHAHQCEQRPVASGSLQQGEVMQVRMDVLIDRVNFGGCVAHDSRRHASQVRHSAVGHEAPAKALHVAIGRVLTGLQNDDSQGLNHATSTIKGL